MQTLLLYLLIMAVVVGVVFAIAWFVFGRGEELPPLDDATTLTRLPQAGVIGDDVRALTFALTARGYKQSEVDWALDRLAMEIDQLHAVIDRLHNDAPPTVGQMTHWESSHPAVHADDTGPARSISGPSDAGPDATEDT